MTNRAAYGPGKGPIGFERLGSWRTSPTDQASIGPPLVFSAGTYSWKSAYGVLYKITGVAGSGAGAANDACLGGGGSGGGGGGFVLWWVGDGNPLSLVVGAAASATSVTSGGVALATATGGGNGVAGTPGAAGSASGAGLLVSGGVGALAPISGSSVPGGASAFGWGSGGRGGVLNTAGVAGQLTIEVVPPLFNSQAGSWEPGI